MRNKCVTQIQLESKQITMLGTVTWFLDVNLVRLYVQLIKLKQQHKQEEE